MPREHTIERAVLVGLNADCFSKEETATKASLEELEALLETAGGVCTAKILKIAIRRIPAPSLAPARPKRSGNGS